MGGRSDERTFVGKWGTFVDLGVEWELQVRVCLGRKSVHLFVRSEEGGHDVTS